MRIGNLGNDEESFSSYNPGAYNKLLIINYYHHYYLNLQFSPPPIWKFGLINRCPYAFKVTENERHSAKRMHWQWLLFFNVSRKYVKQKHLHLCHILLDEIPQLPCKPWSSSREILNMIGSKMKVSLRQRTPNKSGMPLTVKLQPHKKLWKQFLEMHTNWNHWKRRNENLTGETFWLWRSRSINCLKFRKTLKDQLISALLQRWILHLQSW